MIEFGIKQKLVNFNRAEYNLDLRQMKTEQSIKHEIKPKAKKNRTEPKTRIEKLRETLRSRCESTPPAAQIRSKIKKPGKHAIPLRSRSDSAPPAQIHSERSKHAVALRSRSESAPLAQIHSERSKLSTRV
ncbi:hypothetical protein AXF42_Ash019553 [Apostasia shenzhenica]|uniref:Uncharacterized protein n=1 Tax=Apostasia shenzhenica TaxID=1088818 RepID=A0A2I0AV34_9ASPA|nr:hypothetical protein AXF42_Ash019553 [Apostasia shenzhenica]